MKKTAILAACALVVGLVAIPAIAAHKSHDMTVEFVAFDAKAKTVTFKTDAGESKTAPVMEPAMKAFSNFKPGDKIMLTCDDNDKGEHQGVSMVKSAAKKPSA
jgi:hypothetical protein